MRIRADAWFPALHSAEPSRCSSKPPRPFPGPVRPGLDRVQRRHPSGIQGNKLDVTVSQPADLYPKYGAIILGALVVSRLASGKDQND